MKKLVQIVTIILQAGMLGALFLPAIVNYDQTASLLEYFVNAFKEGNKTAVLLGIIYYISVLMGLLLVALLDSKIRYAISLMSASIGITVVLSEFVLKAMESGLFTVYQIGIYLLLVLQLLTIIFSCVGICAKEVVRPKLSLVASKANTTEIPLQEITEQTGKKGKRKKKKEKKIKEKKS